MLEVKNICAGYGKNQVLTAATLNFEKGKITAIIGPNGCGKSTLLKTASGILNPISGQVIVDGHLLTEMSRKQTAQQIAYLPQGKTVPDMTVSQMVLHGRFPYLNYPRRYTREDRDIAFSAMKSMGIENYAEMPLSSLSGGMQQSVYIAMALCQNAEYILMDEPTTYLDISNSLKLMEMLTGLANCGKGVAVVLHDLTLALEFADKIVVMQDGRTVVSGSSDEVYNSGIINDVFDVDLRRIAEDDSVAYRFDRKLL